MKLWRDNKVDQEWERSEEDIARGFHASPWRDYEWPLDRKLQAYLAAKEADGGLQSTWVNEQAYDRVVELVEQGYETEEGPVALTPERLVAARAIDILISLSDKSLRDLRRPDGDPRGGQWSTIPRRRLRELAQALDEAYPGALDATVRAVQDGALPAPIPSAE